MTLIDTLIHARWVIPVIPHNTVLEHHSVVIKNSIIVDILPTIEAKTQYQATVEIERPDHAVLPGFVNAHTHAAMNLLKGLGNDKPLMEWLQHDIWPAEQKHVNAEFVKEGTQLAIAEMLRSGTTCFNDMYFFPDIVADTASAVGIRAVVGIILIDFPSAWATDAADYLHKGIALHDNLRDNPLISTIFAPHAPYTVSDEPLTTLQNYAAEMGLRVHMHVHETAQEVSDAITADGESPLQRLDRLNLLGPDFVAVHMTQLTSEDLSLCAKHNVQVVHCPESNLKLASGFCPVASLLEAGINVALGTDGAASNNDLDMLGELKTAALIGKAVANDATAISAAQALAMATINGAKALGLANDIGSLEKGKQADICCIDLNTPETQPLYDPIAQIVYAASRSQITDVWVAGERKLKNRELLNFKAGELTEIAKRWQQHITA